MIPTNDTRCEDGFGTNSQCLNKADTVVDGHAYCNECAKRIMDSAKVADACKNIAAIIRAIAKEIGNESLYGKVFGNAHIEGEDGWTYDSCVNLMQGMCNGGTYHTGYCITPVVEQRTMVLGGKPQDFIQYYVQHEEVTRGVYRYPDGSGEPDTSDLVDDFVTDKPLEAAKKVVLLYIELCINQMFEAKAEEEMANQMMKDELVLEEWYRSQDIRREGMLNREE